MARNGRQQRDNADREIDLHGFTSSQARGKLEYHWARREWHGLQRIRVIHGTGDVLHAVVRLWCEEKGIEWTTEPYNTGVTIILPGRRLQTAPAPPHRPLRDLRKQIPRKPTPSPRPPREPDASDDELFAQELDRLAGRDSAQENRDKGFGGPTPRNSNSPTTQQSDGPSTIGNRKPEIENPADPMEAEFERLAGEDPDLTRRRKIV